MCTTNIVENRKFLIIPTSCTFHSASGVVSTSLNTLTFLQIIPLMATKIQKEARDLAKNFDGQTHSTRSKHVLI